MDGYSAHVLVADSDLFRAILSLPDNFVVERH